MYDEQETELPAETGGSLVQGNASLICPYFTLILNGHFV